jgi:hypothetical protein
VEENVVSPSRVGQRIWTGPCRIRNSRAFLDRMPFLPHPRPSVRVQVDRSRSSDQLYFCRVVFAKRVLPQIIGISSETGRRCRYARRFMPDFGKDDPAEYETQEPSLIECLFYPTLDRLSGYKWTSLGSVARQGGGVGMPEDSCQIA